MTARPQDVALLPCPFCGDTPTMKNIRADENQGTKWGGVVCSCGVVGPEVRTDYMPVDHWGDRAIEAWNARANVTAALASAQAREEALRAEVAQLDEANRQLHAHGTQMYAELEELRPKCDGLTAEVEHHTAYTITHRGALRYCNSNMRDAYSDEKVRADAAEARAERLAEALRKIATVAHAGGSVGMSEADALTAIRKLTLKHWDRNAEPKHVRAALSTNAATQTGERTW